MKEQVHGAGDWQGEKGGFNIQKWIGLVLSYWPWFLACVIVALSVAFLYLRYTTPQYTIYSRILVKDEKASNMGQTAVLQEIGMNTGKSSVDNEVEIMKSRALMLEVVRKEQLYTRVWTTGTFKNLELINGRPFVFTY